MTKNKKFLVVGIAVIGIAALTVSIVNMNIASDGNAFVVRNAEVLTQECESGRSSGSPYHTTCGAPYTYPDGTNTPCTTNITTCQGSTNCCTPRSCSVHN